MNSPADPNVRPVIGWGWRNPFFRRYCRSRLRMKGMFIGLLIVEMLAGFLFAISRAASSNIKGLPIEDLARAPIIPLLFLQGAILFILGTAQAAGGMVAERDEGVIDYQRLAPMRPLSKVLGYLFGLPVREYVLVLATMPFTAWSLWKGQVAMAHWLPVYGVFFSSALLYHTTGLVTGTVVKNRRWAFLISIGLVFSLYTAVPQLSRFGLVFFHYLTLGPVYSEHLPNLLPHQLGAAVKLSNALDPVVKFFDLDFSETTFTLFSQGCLLITFLIMLRRRWRRHEAHLLGKAWAVIFFAWVQILLLGNALPQIPHGDLFPSHGFATLQRLQPVSDLWHPYPSEATLLSGLYGLACFGFIIVLSSIVTATKDDQSRGWRRARKHGRRWLPVLSDEANATWFTLVMALAGAAAWFIFSRALVESHWFPDNKLAPLTQWLFGGVLIVACLLHQTLLEWRGGRAVGLSVLLIGVAPILIGSVIAVLPGHAYDVAAWVFGLSPASLPLYAAQIASPIADLPPKLAGVIPHAFYFWLSTWSVVCLWLLFSLIRSRRATARKILAAETPAP